ncbi:MAG: NTP transferase domain-containing protein [Candidatus Gastranaerophilales bacterium]|nr:NTP transferase domain-containing protein [Candidatus Gastranaerophilales bacterium]
MGNEIRAIILGAGKGTRMKSNSPKVLHEIFAKPLLGWVLDSINKLPYETESIVVIGHGAHDVEEYLNHNYKYVKTTLQKEQLGTGHAVAQALPLLADYRGTVIITCGDTPLLTTKTLRNLIKYHEENFSDLTVMTTKFENPTGYGRIIRSTTDEVMKIIEEKDASDTVKEIKEVNTGVYCLDWAKIRKAFSELKNNNAQGEYYLTDIIKWARENQYKVLGYVARDNEEIYGINSRQNLAVAANLMKRRYLNELMTNGVTIVDPNSTYISPETEIGEDTIIYPNTYIEGKNKIAKNCKIGPMAHLRGNCEVGEGSKIGNFVELKNAKVAKKTNVCHLSYIGDAEVGSHVNIGAGTIFANYNSVTKEKKKSVLEDNVSIGSNSVIVAPVQIGEGALIAASSCITKDVEAHSLAMSRGHQKEIKNWVKDKKENK